MRRTNFAPGKIYHIYNRGVDKRDIFKEDADKWRFLQALALFNNRDSSTNTLWRLEKKKEGVNMRTLREFLKDREENPLVRIMADCLMDNHYHLILEELVEKGISDFMHKLGTGYTMYFNKKYGRSGSLFQGPFKAIQVDNNLYLQYLLVYINVLNPGQLYQGDLKEKGVKDVEKIIDFASNYDWSTNKEFLGERNSFFIDKGVLDSVFSGQEEYKDFVKAVINGKKYRDIKHLMLE